ncbi:hypothetical protein [Paraburkholderia phosphatilytica]|uniref:hypothetical protein n=1 Tax=Paraburkholderia phosphatilytica TaxID=2282883 RepID=UPI000E4E7748|nr:hypothetical protein [Paraburkholderia phosphatilytica]
MKALIERQLYHPAVVLPLLALVQLLVALDFNLSQFGFVLLTRGAQAALHRARGVLGVGRGSPCGGCHA